LMPIIMKPQADEQRLSDTLEHIRVNGYVLTDSLFTEGLRILAVPVLDIDGYPVGAISIAAPAVRCTAEELKARALETTLAAADAIGKALQANGSVG